MRIMTMPTARIYAVAFLFLAGCGVSPPALQKAEAPPPKAPEPVAARTPEGAPAKVPPPPATAPAKPAAKSPAVAAKPATPPPSTTSPRAPVPTAARPSAPPLDLRSLEQRLKETPAIGVLTKLSLKNQVDDLLARFRTFHEGRRPPTLVELRPAFELLLMKVLSLVQDHDHGLASDINASREAIWGVLTDRDRLSQFL